MTTQAFYGFNAANPQHLIWLKRKIANAERYKRRQARLRLFNPLDERTWPVKGQRRRPEHNLHRLPRHLQSRKPPFSYWWSKPVSMRRNAVTGVPEMKSRLAWWNEVHQQHQKGGSNEHA